jgi:hypothetical protein
VTCPLGGAEPTWSFGEPGWVWTRPVAAAVPRGVASVGHLTRRALRPYTSRTVFRQAAIIVGVAFVSALAWAPFGHVHDEHGHRRRHAPLFHSHAVPAGSGVHVRATSPDDDARWLAAFVLVSAMGSPVPAPADLATPVVPGPDRAVSGVADIEPRAHAPPAAPIRSSRAPPA